MASIPTRTPERTDSLAQLIGHSEALHPAGIRPVPDLTECLTALCHMTRTGIDAVHIAGHCTPDVALAIDRAELRAEEHLGASPFSADPRATVDALTTGRETVYVANPNRVTGSSLGLSDLEILATAVPDGLLIVDEYYHDFYGISAAKLIELFPNVVVLRSLTSAFGIASSEAGYLIASPAFLTGIADDLPATFFTSTLTRILTAALDNGEAKALRLKRLHDESLRIAKTLNRLKIRCRIGATDFLLAQVADPARVGNSLTKAKVAVRNLDGYPELRGYIQLSIQSEVSNDALLNAFRRMPKEYYELRSGDMRTSELRKGAEVSAPASRQEPEIEVVRRRVDIDQATEREEILT